MKRMISYLPITALGIFLIVLSTIKISSQDTFLHLKAGEHILQNMEVPRTDIFSYTASGKSWVYHEWLFAVIIFIVYKIGDITALSIFTAILITVSFLLLYTLIRKQEAGNYLSIIIVISVFLGSRFFFSLRPHQFSYLFIIVTMVLLERYKKGEKKALWMIPPLMTLWANIHSGCVYGLGIMIMYASGSILDAKIRDNVSFSHNMKAHKPLITLILISLIATMINPFTYKTLTYPFETMLLNSREFTLAVIEWRPTTFAAYPHFFIWFGVIGILMMYYYRNIYCRDVILFLAFGYFGFKAERGTVEFMMVTAPLAGRLLQTGLAAKLNGINTSLLDEGKKFKWIADVIFSGLVIYLCLLSVQRHGPGSFGIGINNELVPEKAVEFLNTSGIRGNMFNSYDFGGYLIWFCYPERLVFVDGRHDVHSGYLKNAAHLKFDDLTRRYNLNYLVLRSIRSNDEPPDPAKWALVFWGDVGRIYLKRSEENHSLLEKYEYKIIQPDQKSFEYLVPYIENPLTREELIRELHNSISFDPQNLNALVMLAYVYKSSGYQYLDMAANSYREAIRLRPDEAFLHNSLGSVFMQLKRLSDAREEFEAAIKIDPSYPQAYYNLSRYYEFSGDQEKAGEYRKKFEELQGK